MNVPNDDTIDDLAELFHTLGDRTRLKILYSLETGPKCVNCICEDVDMGISAVSHQLRLLKDRNLVNSKRSGKNVIYSLSDNHVHQIILTAREHLIE